MSILFKRAPEERSNVRLPAYITDSVRGLGVASAGVFVDRDGRTHLFYQGNRDKGRTWYLSRVAIEWRDGQPVVKP